MKFNYIKYLLSTDEHVLSLKEGRYKVYLQNTLYIGIPSIIGIIIGFFFKSKVIAIAFFIILLIISKDIYWNMETLYETKNRILYNFGIRLANMFFYVACLILAIILVAYMSGANWL